MSERFGEQKDNSMSVHGVEITPPLREKAREGEKVSEVLYSLTEYYKGKFGDAEIIAKNRGGHLLTERDQPDPEFLHTDFYTLEVPRSPENKPFVMTVGLQIIRKPSMNEDRFGQIEKEVVDYADKLLKEKGISAHLVLDTVEMLDKNGQVVEKIEEAEDIVNIFTAREKK